MSTIYSGVHILDREETFNLTEIVKIFEGHINRHFVIHLVERKIIAPLRDVKGRGKSRKYSYQNLLQIGVFIYLTKFKLSYEKAMTILAAIENEYGLLEDVFYVCVIGFLGHTEEVYLYGDSEDRTKVRLVAIDDLLSDHIDFSDYKNISPIEEGFIPIINYLLKKEPEMKDKNFAYCFILNIRNIQRYLDSRIRQI